MDLFGPTVAVVGAGASNAGRPRLPYDLSVISRFRRLLGEEGVEELMVQTSAGHPL